MAMSSTIKNGKVFVAGHRGMVGSAIARRLEAMGCSTLTRPREQLDLTDQRAVDTFFADERPDIVFLCAAKVGGILANKEQPAEFIRDNLVIQTNVIHSAWKHGTQKLVFLGSSCIYPRDCPQPIVEESLLTGPLESTNQWYALAKIAGLKMCQAYRQQYGFDAISLMPTNLYGPGDNFHPTGSHVLPALLRRLHEAALAGASSVTIWGTGRPMREFLHVDDLADAAIFLAEHYSSETPINVGSGVEISIRALAEMIAEVVGFSGNLEFDPSKPDGTPRKLLSSSKLGSMGWKPSVTLHQGIADTFAWFRTNAVRG